MTPGRTTLRSILRERVHATVLFVVGFLLVASGLYMFGALNAVPLPSRFDRPEPTRAELLVENHGCWTGEAPADMAGVVPGHVVVTLPGADGPVYSHRLVHLALDQAAFDHPEIFGAGGRDHGAIVHAFCR